jgi:protein phosphatase
MQQALPVIYCPNLKCRTTNPEGASACQQCGTRLPNRYLWVLGLEPNPDRRETSLMDRYGFRGDQVVIDTQPGIPLISSFDITDDLLPYLKLFPWRLHLPQIYSLLPADLSAKNPEPMVLLEGAPLTFKDFKPSDALSAEEIRKIAIAEDFTEAWKQAPDLRQVNWLWQMAQLWAPLQREGVASSLIDPQLLRVEGPLLRLLSLNHSPNPVLPLSELGRFWERWCLPSAGRWQSNFADLCDRLMDGQITTVEPLIDHLEAWLAAVRASSSIRIDVATRTDPGPTREHNEDACYPSHGVVTQNVAEGLMIVCDGVGGHAGGEVASGIAIKSLTDYLQQTPLRQLSPPEVIQELETAVGIANDQIAQENDRENRHDRDRMGTTVVMALEQNQDLYISNLGDSRAYLITDKACYQLTTDDDIATREVRLGYLPHREAQRQPGSGSLIQALGMVPASMLRPATTRLLLDSDCLFLLCSDGLSDFERVESLWREELLPLLQGHSDLAETTKRLIVAANRLNGHDNVTVALLHCHKKDVSAEETVVERSQIAPPAKTQLRDRPLGETPRRSPIILLWAIGLLSLFGVGAAFAYLYYNSTKPPVVSSPNPTIAPSGSGVPSPGNTPIAFASNTYWEIQPMQVDSDPKATSATPPAPAPAPLEIRAAATLSGKSLGILTQGMVLKILPMPKSLSDPAQWLYVKLCHVPELKAGSAATSQPSQALPSSTAAKEPTELASSKEGYVELVSFKKNASQVIEGTLGTRKQGCLPAATESPNP